MLRLARAGVVALLTSTVVVTAHTSAGATSVIPRGTTEVSAVLTEMAPLIARNRQGPTRASRLYGIIGYSMLAASGARPAFMPTIKEPIELAAPPTVLDYAIAALAAGTTAVRKLMPTQLDRTTYAELRDRWLAGLAATAPEGTDVRASIARGAAAVAAVLARAKGDGLDGALKMKYAASDTPGAWAPTPPAFQGAIDPGWGTLRTYLPSTANCTLPAPPRSSDAANPFGQAAREVADIAAALTDDQRMVARFWDDGRGRSSTPSGHWVEIAARAAEATLLPATETITLFGAMTMALSDGVVANWREKYRWSVERPVTVVSRTDPEWNSYLTTPAFPEYPSGHSTISRVASDMLTATIGDWSFTDPGWGLAPGSRKKFEIEPRSFASFRAAADEAGQSRVYGGIHYGFSIEAGAELGSCVATNFLAQ
ncbi:MAG: vanadium-dependent haloperoxidase [Actinomycetota bacterium]